MTATDLTTACSQCGQPMMQFPDVPVTPCNECSLKTQQPSPENVARAIEGARGGVEGIMSAFAQRGWSIVSS